MGSFPMLTQRQAKKDIPHPMRYVKRGQKSTSYCLRNLCCSLNRIIHGHLMTRNKAGYVQIFS